MAGRKNNFLYQEKYKKGTIVNKREILRMISENIDKITIEMRERTVYLDKQEGIVIEVRY
jgi:phage-related protein